MHVTSRCRSLDNIACILRISPSQLEPVLLLLMLMLLLLLLILWLDPTANRRLPIFRPLRLTEAQATVTRHIGA
jgi:hypothetical protein